MVAESYKAKAVLIREREHYFNENDYLNNKYFPKYILVRRPVAN